MLRKPLQSCAVHALFASSLAFTWSANATPQGNLALTTADRYIGVGEKLVVAVSLAGSPVDGVGAQLVLNYDSAKLSLDSRSIPGVLDLLVYELNAAGVYKLALGTTSGNSNVSIAGNIVVLTFSVTGEFADVSSLVAFGGGSGRVSSKISDASGSPVALEASSDLGAVTRDITAPVLTAGPGDFSMWADADGLSRAVKSLTAPTVVTDLDPAVVIVRTRAGSVDSSNSFPANATTQVIWTATDNCGNSASVHSDVDVSANSLAHLDVAMGGSFVASSFTRGISVAVGSQTLVSTVPMAPAGSGSTLRAEGAADMVVSASSDIATMCATVCDPLHSLKRAATVTKSSVAGSSGGRSYNSRYMLDAAANLKIGNANGDSVIDIFDFGTFVAQRGGQLALDTVANQLGIHSDFNASSDGVSSGSAADVTNADLAFLAVNFFAVDEGCGAFTNQQPVARVSVKELRRIGLGSQEFADINGDGWVDTTDMSLMMQGVEPRRLSRAATVNAIR